MTTPEQHRKYLEQTKQRQKRLRAEDPEWKAKAYKITKDWRERNKERIKAQNKKTRDKQKANRNSPEVIASFKSTSLRANAKRRGIEVSVGAVELLSLLLSQNKKCALTGRELVYNGLDVGLNSPSVDRIDSSMGYHKDNIRWVTYQSNMARANGTDEDLLRFCEDVLKHHGYGVLPP